MRQPLLHDQMIALSAPLQIWSRQDGQIHGDAGAGGIYHADRRIVNELTLVIGFPGGEAAAPEHIYSESPRVDTARVVSLARNVDSADADPRVRCEQIRVVTPEAVTETIRLSSALERPLDLQLHVRWGSDLATMAEVKQGQVRPQVAFATGDVNEHRCSWGSDGVRVSVWAPGAALRPSEEGLLGTWQLRLEPASQVEVTWTISATDPSAVVTSPAWKPEWAVSVEHPDPRLAELLERGLGDIEGLLMSSSKSPADIFVAAGAPWFFTLFGRDSLWAARFLLPLGTDLAAATLRTLAAYQGQKYDSATGEEPGKILHEIRSESQRLDTGAQLPSVYYGSVDATSLWCVLLVEAWRWGLPPEQIEPLLDNLEAALAWQVSDGDPDQDGFLEYFDASGRGLANQGWKDSSDSIRFRDGTLASGPIALVEVQAYAYEAAVGGADLLEAFGRDAQRWRVWAEQLRARFAGSFWVSDAHGPYPAIALDRHKRPVDSLTSNIGHLLGTGILSPEQEHIVADRLMDSSLLAPTGLRTLAAGQGDFWPLSYHGGSIWTHDTAIAVMGLSRAGFTGRAQRMAETLLLAAPAFSFRMPELFSGDGVPVPYPASCRPQAWAAAAAVVLAIAPWGVRPNAPARRLEYSAAAVPGAARAVRGLAFGGRRLDLFGPPDQPGRDGELRVVSHPGIDVSGHRR